MNAIDKKRLGADLLDRVQQGNRRWWETTPMSYDWNGEASVACRAEWFADQDRRSAEAHGHFATNRVPFDRLIPHASLKGKDVLEIGVGSGFHAELMARAGARVTGIDITEAAVARTQERFALKGLPGTFERWDAERPRGNLVGRFDFVWSWGVVHHSAHTARIVRNVARWLRDDAAFGGMVYHRDSTSAAIVLLRDWLLTGRFLTRSLYEALWRRSDGFTARFYPAEQWRDLLLGFFDEGWVRVTGNEADALPLPRVLRRRVAPRIPSRLRDRILSRAGSSSSSFRRDGRCAEVGRCAG